METKKAGTNSGVFAIPGLSCPAPKPNPPSHCYGGQRRKVVR